MSRLVKIIVVPIAAVLLFIFIVWPFSPAGRQASNLKAADSQIPSIRSTLKQNPNFYDLRVSRFTGGGGGIMIVGYVKNDEIEDTLRETIASLNLPFYVKYVFTGTPRPPAITNESTTPSPEPY